MVEIKLRNVGDLAYRPEVYGDLITIQRTLKRTGASSVKTFTNKSGKRIFRYFADSIVVKFL